LVLRESLQTRFQDDNDADEEATELLPQ
jgi:hypothetical protein